MKTLAPIDSEGRKRCLACQQVKLAEEFRFDPKQAHYDSGGRRTKCKTCEAELARRKYHGSIESRVKTIIAAAKWRARRNGIPFTLQPSDVVIPSRCPVLGVPLAYNAAGFGTHRDPYTPSLDRYDPQKGYVPGNVVVVSWLANRLKSDCTDPEVFEKVAAYLRSQQTR